MVKKVESFLICNFSLGREIADVRDMKILDNRDKKSFPVTTHRRRHSGDDICNKMRNVPVHESNQLFASGDDLQLTQKTKILVENNLSCTPRNLDQMRNRIKNFKKSLTT